MELFLFYGYSYFLAELYHCLEAVCRVFQQVAVGSDGVLLKEQDDSRAAELELSLLLAADERVNAVAVADTSDQHCSDLYLRDIAEIIGVQDGVFAGVALVDVISLHCDGIDRMQLAAYEGVVRLCAAVDVAVAVVVVHLKAEDEAVTALESAGEEVVFQQVAHAVVRVLYAEYAPVVYPVDRELRVTRADEVIGDAVYRALSGFILRVKNRLYDWKSRMI